MQLIKRRKLTGGQWPLLAFAHVLKLGQHPTHMTIELHALDVATQTIRFTHGELNLQQSIGSNSEIVTRALSSLRPADYKAISLPFFFIYVSDFIVLKIK